MVALAALLLAASPADTVPRAQHALALLDYVAGDYPSAVGPNGELLSADELKEQASFARECADELRPVEDAADLVARIDALAARIVNRDRPASVVVDARRIDAAIQERYRLTVLPPRRPALANGERVYRESCAACHGRDGHPENVQLTTRPPAFASKEVVRKLAPLRIYRATTYGVPETAMPAFGDALDEASRWDVAWYVLTLAHADPAERERGLQLFRMRSLPDYRQLAVRTDDELRRSLSSNALSPDDREAVLSAVRSK